MKIKKSILLGLLCCCVCSATIGLILTQAETADNVIIYDNFALEYELGDTLSIMGGSVVDDGTTYELKTLLKYPSGTQTKYSNALLSETGEYTLDYFYEINGTVKSVDTKTFSVIITPKNLFRASGEASLTSNVDTPSYARTQKNGVELTFQTEQDAVRYSTPIDVSDNTKNDTLIELMATPEIEGIKEFTEFDIRLYDMNNPDIWINFNFENAAWGYEQNMMLAVSTSTTEGVTFGNRWTYGGTDATWQRSTYTHLGSCHTYGKINNTRVSVTKLYYDATENAVYARTYHDWNMDGFLTCLLDLDDPNQVGQNYVWSGFPSGKAYMEITATPSQEAHMLVFKVDDRKLSGKDMEGAYTTSIEVKTPQELFTGVVGAEYPIFEASASDSYGNVFDKLNVSVYMDETDGESMSRRYFPLKEHSFETPISGEYTIEYSFLDYYGVEKKKIISVIVEEEDATLEYIPSSSIKTEYKVGEKIYLLNGEIEGAVGDYSIKKSVYFTATGETARQEVEPTDNGMGPFVSFETTGTVEIEVIVIDALGRSVKEIAYEFNVVYPDQIMINTPSLPIAVFKDLLFTLPNVTAVAYQNGQKVDAEVLTFVNNQNVSNTMTYTPTTTDTLTVSYRSKNGDVLFEDSVQVKEKNATVFADNYFVFDNMQSQCFTNESGTVEYRLSAIQAGSARASFIKKLSADILSMSFDVIQGKEAESISVRLVDSVNANESLLCTLKKGEKAGKAIVELYLNGSSVRAGVMEGSIDGATSALLNIGYDSKAFAITDVMGNRVAKVSAYENGDVFHGFSSGYAYVNVEFHNVAADYQIVWTSLANQTFTDSFVDTTAPMLLFSNDTNTIMADLNEVVVCEKPTVADVFSDKLSLTVTIRLTKSDGTVVNLYDGSAEDVDLNLCCEYVGVYLIMWNGSDGRNAIRIIKSVEVLDYEAPTLEIDERLTSIYSVNKQVDFPTATVKGGSYFVRVEEINTGKVWACKSYEVKNENEKKQFYFTFPRTGNYRIVYVAYDSSMNKTEYSINIIVE